MNIADVAAIVNGNGGSGGGGGSGAASDVVLYKFNNDGLNETVSLIKGDRAQVISALLAGEPVNLLFLNGGIYADERYCFAALEPRLGYDTYSQSLFASFREPTIIDAGLLARAFIWKEDDTFEEV